MWGVMIQAVPLWTAFVFKNGAVHDDFFVP
jgi:hypothetical protein